jgi:HTH-type transcriptional regulator/antitoxin HigA
MNATKNSPFSPNYAVPPGSALEEWLEERSMSQTELAERMDRPIKTINEIIKGKTSITQETALQLAAVTGIEASFWTNADRIFQERAARLAEEERLASWSDWAKRFPFAEMVKLAWLPPVPQPAGRVRALLRFFAVASPDGWRTRYDQVQVAYRQSPAFKSDPAHLGAWLRRGELQAEQVPCEPYAEAPFRAALAEIRSLTHANPRTACDTMIAKCRAAGVAVVFVPELSKTRVSGATRWLSSTKALLQLSLRHKRDDHLWFTFFHESAHILLHGKKEVFVEFNGKDSAKEHEANRWAADFLIPPADWRGFLARSAVKSPDILCFARQLGIAPGIVVGRLQREKIIPYTACNALTRRLCLVPDAASGPVAK